VDERLNFEHISALVVDSDRYSTSTASQILRGSGLTRHFIAYIGAGAMNVLVSTKLDLVISECVLPDMAAAEFVHRMRKHRSQVVKYLPIVMLTGYAQLGSVTAVRDSGANSFVRQPVSPSVLFDHIAWTARSERPFVECDVYVGPCRRFKFDLPVPGAGRRAAEVAPRHGPRHDAASTQPDEHKAGAQ
jgi:two-component system, chemotaxis family, chemotaxis protein CheY